MIKNAVIIRFKDGGIASFPISFDTAQHLENTLRDPVQGHFIRIDSSYYNTREVQSIHIEWENKDEPQS